MTSERAVSSTPAATRELALARATGNLGRASARRQPSALEPGEERLSPSITLHRSHWQPVRTASNPSTAAVLAGARRWSFAPTRSARAPPVAQSPRGRSETDAACRGQAEAMPRWSDSAARAACSRERTNPRSPPVDPLSWAARRLPPPAGGVSTRPTEPPLRVCTRSASSPGTVGDTGCSRSLPPGVEGRFTRGPAKSQGIGRTRGAFRRWAAFVESTGLTSRVI